ncbi:copper resistance protein B [Acinetobacter sp. NIPH 2699]|uniref:copper resistance protein B n=1 Tax=Acinetobacter sp. NIPH 2699 TaxID=2923433 RepID=UPI001F4BDB49|nr:copper resistance protein B [Acinetobacter sp. NIPH 2699]MCH7337791.1 copper resistance protein B [Acinetobacter sp. NIPH 2699]
MHITKRSSEMKRSTRRFFIGGMMSSLSVLTYAHEGHDQMMQTQMNRSEQSSTVMDHSLRSSQIKSVQSKTAVQHQQHDHRREHGGQIYQATTLESAWTIDDHGRGSASTELKTWVGTDENKIFVKAHVEKAESKQADTEAKVLYSRNIADFWDVQAGVRYQYQSEQQQDQNQWSAVFGLHGLAPYFFETDAYVYAGQDQRWQLSLETSRDFLFTQKLIAQPYLNADIVLSDQSKYARKSGLAKLQTGIQMRYEISKKVMPFIDVAYAYSKGVKQTEWQTASQHEKGGLYGAGLTLKF